MLRVSRLVLSVAALSVPLAAQTAIQSRWLSATEIVVDSTREGRKVVAQGVRLDGGGILVSGGAVVLPRLSNRGEIDATATLQLSGRALAGEFARTGSHETLLSFSAQRAVPVILELDAETMAVGSGARWRGEIDVGDDGSIELVATESRSARRSLKLMLGPAGVTIRTKTRGATGVVAQESVYGATVRIRVRPDYRCSAQWYGGDCRMPFGFTGYLNFDGAMAMDFSGAYPNATGVQVVGAQPIRSSIGGSGCDLLTTALDYVPFRTDAQGRSSLRNSIPATFAGDAYFQWLLIDQNGELRASPGNAIRCR